MKAVSKLVVLFSAGVLSALAASASTLEQTYLDTCRKDSRIPVPIAVVTPAVSSEYAGTNVDVAFVVNAQGQPENLSLATATDSSLGSAVVEAVRQWKFKPAERDGQPVAMKVVLPVKIVDPTLRAATIASN